MTADVRRFPDGFRWGCASSAYQNEGENRNADWWRWEEGAGHIAGGQRSGRACDWWGDGFLADLEWMTRLHQNAHRLSVEWSRIEPRPGHFDPAALDRYRFMLLALRERGIEPMVTLHHFTLPLWLAERGGWERDETVALFERFVTRTVAALRDLCSLWITINEPVIHAVLGWLQSRGEERRHQTTFPPGKSDVRLAARVLLNQLRGHAAAYHAIHRVQSATCAGIAHHMQVLDPLRERSPLDRLLAQVQDRIMNRLVLDAVLRGRLPAFMGRRHEPALRDTADFLGINYYTREFVTFDARLPGSLFGRRVQNPDAVISDGHFGEIHPEGLLRLLRRLRATRRPIFITENGLPDAADTHRAQFIRSHLESVHRALQDGVPVHGYYHWTLTDNFEWAEGWNLRFGLIELDPASQRRSPRPSARLYSEVCRTGTLPPAPPGDHALAE